MKKISLFLILLFGLIHSNEIYSQSWKDLGGALISEAAKKAKEDKAKEEQAKKDAELEAQRKIEEEERKKEEERLAIEKEERNKQRAAQAKIDMENMDQARCYAVWKYFVDIPNESLEQMQTDRTLKAEMELFDRSGYAKLYESLKTKYGDPGNDYSFQMDLVSQSTRLGKTYFTCQDVVRDLKRKKRESQDDW